MDKEVAVSGKKLSIFFVFLLLTNAEIRLLMMFNILNH